MIFYLLSILFAVNWATIFEKSICPPSKRANLFIMKSRHKVINAFGIQYWVSPSCMTGFMSPGAELKGDIMWEKKACCLARTAIFFLKRKKIWPCFLTALHYTFPRKGWHFHPYWPLLHASLIYDEKDFKRLRKTDKTRWK